MLFGGQVAAGTTATALYATAGRPAIQLLLQNDHGSTNDLVVVVNNGEDSPASSITLAAGKAIVIPVFDVSQVQVLTTGTAQANWLAHDSTRAEFELAL